MQHDWEYFNNQLFLGDFEKNNWNQVLQLNQNNVNLTSDNYLDTMNALINSHAPLKKQSNNKAKKQQKKQKSNKKQQQFQQKPQITRGIQNSIHNKNILFKKYIKCNNPKNKNALHNEFKIYRNNFAILMKQNK